MTPAGAAPVRLALHGAHQVPNALAAAAIAAELGLARAEHRRRPVRRHRTQPVADGGHAGARAA